MANSLCFSTLVSLNTVEKSGLIGPSYTSRKGNWTKYTSCSSKAAAFESLKVKEANQAPSRIAYFALSVKGMVLRNVPSVKVLESILLITLMGNSKLVDYVGFAVVKRRSSVAIAMLLASLAVS